MTLAEYADQLFRYATGWLGWTPEAALRASIHHILLAMDGKMDFLRKTNPYVGDGGGADQPAAATPSQAAAAEKPDPAKAAQQLMAALRRRQAPQR